MGLPAASSSIELGTVVHGTYRVDTMLGEGGMAVVYRAHHLKLGTDVALKVMKREALRDPDASKRFLREAQHATGLRSEHVARILDVGKLEDGMPFILMEFLAGADLGTMLEHHVSLSTGHAVDLVLQACDAVAEAHSIGIIHRDIKPTNLFVTMRPDGSQQIKLLDFGISKSTMPDMSLTQTASLLGTPSYMSPEQMRSARRVDQRTDIWSLGCVLYELVEGRRPFNAETFSETCVMVAVDPPDPMRRAPELERIVHRCLAKSPDARYSTVAALAVDLAAFADDPTAARHYVDRTHRLVGSAPQPITDYGSAAIAVPISDFHSAAIVRPVSDYHSAAIAVAAPELADDTIIAPTDAGPTDSIGPIASPYRTGQAPVTRPPPRVFVSAGIGLGLGLALVMALRFTVFKPRMEIETEGETVVLPTERVPAPPPLPVPDAPAAESDVMVVQPPPLPAPPVKRTIKKPELPKVAPVKPEPRPEPEPVAAKPETGSAEPTVAPPPPEPKVEPVKKPAAGSGSDAGSAKPPCNVWDSRTGC